MRMVPIYTVAGQLLGHLDLDQCHRSQRDIIVDEAPIKLTTLPHIAMSDTLRFFRAHLWEIEFRNDDEDVRVLNTYVVAVDDVPDWVWKSGRAVRFSPDHWRSI